MAEGNVGRLSGAKRERDANELALHRIGRCELGAEGDMALRAGGVEQGGEPLRMHHRLVFAAIEGKRREPRRTLLGEMQRRAFLRRIDRLGALGDEASRRQFAQGMVVGLAALARLLRRWRRTCGSLDAKTVSDTAEQCAEFELAKEA